MTITTRFGNLDGPLDQAIRTYFPVEEWKNAAEISYLESGWNELATNDTRSYGGGQCNVQYIHPTFGPATTEHSVGPWQINLCVLNIAEAAARDPEFSTAFAADLWKRSSWSPWLLAAQQLGLIPSPSPGPGPGQPPPGPPGPVIITPGTKITLEITITAISIQEAP